MPFYCTQIQTHTHTRKQTVILAVARLYIFYNGNHGRFYCFHMENLQQLSTIPFPLTLVISSPPNVQALIHSYTLVLHRFFHAVINNENENNIFAETTIEGYTLAYVLVLLLACVRYIYINTIRDDQTKLWLCACVSIHSI